MESISSGAQRSATNYILISYKIIKKIITKKMIKKNDQEKEKQENVPYVELLTLFQSTFSMIPRAFSISFIEAA